MNLSKRMFSRKTESKNLPVQDYFCKFSNGLFYGKEANEIGILKLVGCDKAFTVLEYLYINTNRKNIIIFTLDHMIVESGFKPNANEKKSNEQFTNILSKFQELGIIKSEFDMGKIKPKQVISCSLEINLTDWFVLLYDTEKDKILNQSVQKTDKLKLLIYYCYLKSRMYKRSNGDYNIQISGGRAEVTWIGYKAINHDLGLTDETITKYNKILVELDMIRIGSAGNWYYRGDRDKVIRESSNIYTLCSEGNMWELNLEQGIKYYKALDINSNKVFTNNRKYLNNNRKLNGELGSIIKKEKLGTATAKNIKRKAEILESKTENIEYKYKIKALFEINENVFMLLSDIYSCLDNHNLCEKYSDLETKLGLVDEENGLTVDWDYYCWVMINYEETEHDYYVNCVSKTIRESKAIA